MANIDFYGWAPDVDPTKQGVIIDCANSVPTLRGYMGSPAPITNGFPALAAQCMGSAYITKLDGSGRFFAGTTSKLYEGLSNAWTDQSKGGGYAGGAESFWRFAQFGDTTYATNGADVLQSSTSSGAFASDASGLKANLIEVANGFTILGSTTDPSNGSQSDRWWCSAYMAGFTGTPSVTTQETTGRLVDVPGPLTGLKRLGSNCVAYKDRGIWLGQYVGAPAVWQFNLIPGEIGCPSQEAIVNIGFQHVFMGYENFYIFDGSRPYPIGDEIKRWFFSDLSSKYRFLVKGAHDRKNSLVRFYYPSNAGNGVIDSCVAFNYQTGKWGRDNLSIESAVEFLVGGISYSGFGQLFAEYANIPNIPYDSAFFNEASPLPTVFKTDHAPYSLTGASASSSITTGDFGDNYVFTTCTRVRLKGALSATTAQATNFYSMVEGDPPVQDQTVSISGGAFDFVRQAKWHRIKFNFTGDNEYIGYEPLLIPGGTQ